MVVIIGNNRTIKRNIISYVISRNIKFVDNNDDVKAYYFLRSYIVNTPDLNIDDIEFVFKKCSIVCGTNIQTCILVLDDTIDTKVLIKIMNVVNSLRIYLVIFNLNDKFNIPYCGDLTIVYTYEHLKEIIVNSINKPYIISGKFIFLGITNVGKSSIINKLLNFDVMKVRNMRNTTKEVSTIPVTYDNKNILLYDTFGLENKTKDRLNAINRIINSVDRAFLVVDPYVYERKINKYIIEFLYKKKVNTTIVLNKVDLVINDKIRMKRIYKDMSVLYAAVDTIYLSVYNDNEYQINKLFEYHYNVTKRNIVNDYINKVIKSKFNNILYIRHIQKVTTHYKFIVMMKHNASKLNIVHIRNIMSKLFNIKDLVLEFVILGKNDQARRH